jgi:hypothetical protein
LEAQGGVLGGVRLRMTIEEHGGGRQLARLRAWPRCAGWGLALAALLTLLTALAALSAAWSAAIMLGLIAALLTLRIAQECATAMSAVLCALHECDDTAQTAPHPAPALLEQREIGGA